MFLAGGFGLPGFLGHGFANGRMVAILGEEGGDGGLMNLLASFVVLLLPLIRAFVRSFMITRMLSMHDYRLESQEIK